MVLGSMDMLLFKNEFSISVKFSSNLSLNEWILTNIYGPSHYDKKAQFLDWFGNIDMPKDLDWIIMGDFNLREVHLIEIKRGGGD
jgi:hypothetical protein